MNSTSACGSTSCRRSGVTTFSTALVMGMSLGSTPITRMPKAWARWAIWVPMPPSPMITAVLPVSSTGRPARSPRSHSSLDCLGMVT